MPDVKVNEFVDACIQKNRKYIIDIPLMPTNTWLPKFFVLS